MLTNCKVPISPMEFIDLAERASVSMHHEGSNFS